MASVAVDRDAEWTATADPAERTRRLDTLRIRLADAATTASTMASAADRTAIETAQDSVGALAVVDPSSLDALELRSWLEGIEGIRRSVDAIGVAATGAIDRANTFGAQGFFSARSAVKHMCRLSGPEAHRRVRVARLHAALPDWREAHAAGRVGIAHTELMARVTANPDIPAWPLDRDAPQLLDDAIRLPYDEFERRARTWEALADADGDRSRNERRISRRHVQVRSLPEGGGHAPAACPTSTAPSSTPSSPGSSRPSGRPTGPRPAAASVTTPRFGPSNEPRPTGEPTHCSPWPAQLHRRRRDRTGRAPPSTCSSTEQRSTRTSPANVAIPPTTAT